MADRVLVDTDVLIDAGRGITEAVGSLAGHERVASLAISVVTEMELVVGCANKAEVRKLDRFLRRFEVVPLDEAASARAAELLRTYRLSHGLLIADALIAATALVSDLELLTKNQRDYRFIRGLRLPPYP